MILISACYLHLSCSSNEQSEQADATSKDLPAFTSDSLESVSISEKYAAGSSAISGHVFFQGQAPALKQISLHQDPACAVEKAAPIYAEEVVLNPDRSLVNVFIYIKEGLPSRSYAVPLAPKILDQHHCRYSPHVMGIQVGQKLKILNSDPTFHNVHASGQKNKAFNLGMSKVERVKTCTFAQSEIMVPLHCNVHPWMSAYVGVVDHPFYAVTDSIGSFKLQALPAGKYVVAAWHEIFGSTEQEIKLAENETKTVDFIFTRR